MSGGSYDYMHHEMEAGEVAKYVRYRERFLEDIGRVLADVQSGEPMRWVPGTGEKGGTYEPYPQAEALIAIPAVLTKVVLANELIADLQALLLELAPIARVVDRWGSGDDGPDRVADACIAWMRKALGLPEKTP